MVRILIVDDEPFIRTILRNALHRHGREIATASTAAQALVDAAGYPSIEVALVDKNLPDRSGLEVARELRHLHPELEVILLTAFASLDSAIEAVKVGAFDYIQKPIESFDDLNAKVENAAEKVRLKRDQRRLLDRYAESEERYRGVFEACGDALLLYDAELGRIHDANAAAERLYGYSREELTALDVSRLGIESPSPMQNLPVSQRHLRKDGSSISVEVSFGEFFVLKRAFRVMAVRGRP